MDSPLTVKAVTLIFISGRGSAISSAKQGKSGSIYLFGKIINKLFGSRKWCLHFMKILTIYTLNSHLLVSINPLNRISIKCMFFVVH